MWQELAQFPEHKLQQLMNMKLLIFALARRHILRNCQELSNFVGKNGIFNERNVDEINLLAQNSCQFTRGSDLVSALLITGYSANICLANTLKSLHMQNHFYRLQRLIYWKNRCILCTNGR